MDALKMKTEDIRKLDKGKLLETADSIRREIATIRMDIYTAPAAHTGKIRGLKKVLARVLTVKNELGKTTVMAKGKKK